MPGIIGSYQANEVIKMITGTGEVLSGKLLMIDALRMDHNLLTIKRNDEVANIKELGEYGDFCHDEFPDVSQITANELYGRIRLGEVEVYDVREKELFDAYHIEGKHVSIEDLLGNPELIVSDKDVVLICEKGVNSAAIIEELEKEYKGNKLYNLDGGIQEWMSQDLPIIEKK